MALRRTSPADRLRKGDIVLVEAGDVIPCDGEVIEGGASVDESAITGGWARPSVDPAAICLRHRRHAYSF